MYYAINIPIIIHTHRNGDTGEELSECFAHDPMVRIVPKGIDGLTSLCQTIHELL
jgi:hypothetical protein